jgi:predicted nucleotidyltransferase
VHRCRDSFVRCGHHRLRPHPALHPARIVTVSQPSTGDAAGPLDPTVEQALSDVVSAARGAFGTDLVSVVLFGSAAEGRMRATSDVNVLLVLERFDPVRADALREPLRLAKAALDLHPMFMLQAELGAAMDAFALRFADIAARHRVLWGPDPFAALTLPREALLRRLRQVLLNLQIRARERYVALSLREEQLVRYIADTAGPLRAAAASLLQLEGRPAPNPKEALESLAASVGEPGAGEALAAMSQAREAQMLPAGAAPAVALALMALIARLRERAEALR